MKLMNFFYNESLKPKFLFLLAKKQTKNKLKNIYVLIKFNCVIELSML